MGAGRDSRASASSRGRWLATVEDKYLPLPPTTLLLGPAENGRSTRVKAEVKREREGERRRAKESEKESRRAKEREGERRIEKESVGW